MDFGNSVNEQCLLGVGACALITAGTLIIAVGLSRAHELVAKKHVLQVLAQARSNQVELEKSLDNYLKSRFGLFRYALYLFGAPLSDILRRMESREEIRIHVNCVELRE